jgi:hypothetical protein
LNPLALRERPCGIYVLRQQQKDRIVTAVSRFVVIPFSRYCPTQLSGWQACTFSRREARD